MFKRRKKSAQAEVTACEVGNESNEKVGGLEEMESNEKESGFEGVDSKESNDGNEGGRGMEVDGIESNDGYDGYEGEGGVSGREGHAGVKGLAGDAGGEGIDGGGGFEGVEAMMAAFEDWLEESVPEGERRESTKSAMDMVRDSLVKGAYDEAMFEVIAKGADYERAVEEAGVAGEIKGRNASIEELLADNADGDGIPHPGSGGSGRNVSRRPSIFDLAREA